eukprot:3480425-Pyramimonas_sp.AAC.1
MTPPTLPLPASPSARLRALTATTLLDHNSLPSAPKLRTAHRVSGSPAPNPTLTGDGGTRRRSSPVTAAAAGPARHPPAAEAPPDGSTLLGGGWRACARGRG